MAIRVGVLGARGRMGTEVCKVVEAAQDLELVAQLDAGDDLAEFERAGVQVVVDFTVPEVVLQNLEWVVGHGMHAVVGTTGWDDARLETVRGYLASQPNVGVMIAANVIALVVMLAASGRIADFVERHPTVKILALAFLVMIGGNLFVEGFGYHIPKGYTYVAMAFSVAVEALNIRVRKASSPVHLHGPGER